MDAALLSDKKISSLFQVIERFREEYPEMPAQRNERKSPPKNRTNHYRQIASWHNPLMGYR